MSVSKYILMLITYSFIFIVRMLLRWQLSQRPRLYLCLLELW